MLFTIHEARTAATDSVVVWRERIDQTKSELEDFSPVKTLFFLTVKQLYEGMENNKKIQRK